jgi:hypothetical protein
MMKRALKWMAVAIVGISGALLAIGLLMPGKPTTGQQAQEGGSSPASSAAAQPVPIAVTAPKPSYSYPPDQCLDGVCIGMSAGELAGKTWRKKDVVGEADVNSQQRELLETEQKAVADLCVTRQTAWGKKAQEMCSLLSLSISNPRSYGYRTPQVSTVLEFFADQNMPVCEFYDKERAYVLGHLPTDTGLTAVKFQFDANGMLRVFEISKAYEDQNAETNTAIADKLKQKHPYVTEPSLDAFEKPIPRGDTKGKAPWGGTVRFLEKEGKAPIIWMTAQLADFEQSNLAACKQAKPVSVQ